MSGTRYERELVNAFESAGYRAMRCPSSGSATPRALPDVVAFHWAPHLRSDGGLPSSEVWAVEAKTTSRTTAYATSEEVDALEAFAEGAGAIPLIGARFKRAGETPAWYLVKPTKTRLTNQGNHGVPADDAENRAFAVVHPDSTNKAASVDRKCMAGIEQL